MWYIIYFCYDNVVRIYTRKCNLIFTVKHNLIKTFKTLKPKRIINIFILHFIYPDFSFYVFNTEIKLQIDRLFNNTVHYTKTLCDM